MKFILASSSPRRKELLERIKIPFEIIASDIDESVAYVSSSPVEIVSNLSQMKAKAVAQNVDGESVIIGADTVVTYLGRIMNKPASRDEAIEMLKLLSGKHHTVYSGMTVIFKDENGNMETETYVDGTDVEFMEMSDEFIEKYVDTGEPFDKAGAYAIQEKGAIFALNVKGNYDNVVGLPVPILYKALKKHGIDITDFWK